MRKNPNPENIINYKKTKAIVRNTIKRAKNCYWENYCEKLNKNSNLTNVWKTIKNVNGNNQSTNNVGLLKSLNAPDMESLCDIFRNHFQQMSSDNNLDTKFKSQQSLMVGNKLQTFVKTSDLPNTLQEDIINLNKPFSITELDLALRYCNKKSACGPDGIPFIFLVKLDPFGRDILLTLINKSWKDGTLPKAWKCSFVKPILKHKKNKNDINSYRPISLISNISKTAEKNVLTID